MNGKLLLLLIVPFALQVNAEDTVDFDRDIRPILSDKCFNCHGPDAKSREAGLRLDLREGLFQQREGHASFVPRKPDESEAIRRISSSDPDQRMPPPDSNLMLSSGEIALLRRWVEEGAEWNQHWAFEPVRRPALPEVSDSAWCRNAVDYFVLSRIDREKLYPSPTASKETLIRRVTLDLTGLPPTPEEVDRFLADDSPRAYENVVDRLLRSTRYGEHMALMWLDAARYADTDGYQNDGPRHMWRWRDWVIDAYNANMPFDQFTIEQLAGDLLPSATLDQKIATGFNRNHRYNSEAGLVLEEFLLENAVDRVDTTSTVWMGLTMGCARCHDHKYDPYSQKEYYQLISMFDNVSESGRAVKFGNSEPWVVAPTREQQAQLADYDQKIQIAADALASVSAKIDDAISDSQSRETSENTKGSHTTSATIARGLAHYFSFDDTDKRAKVESGKPTYQTGVSSNAISLDGQSVLALGKAGDVLGQKRSSIAFWIRPDDTSRGVILSRQSRNTRRPGFVVELESGHVRWSIITRWISGVGAVETVAKLQLGEWVHVCVTNDGSQSARGMRIYLDGKRVETKIVYNTNSNTGGTAASMILRAGGGVHGAKFSGMIDELCIYNRTLWDDEINILAVAEPVAEILQKPDAKRTVNQKRKLRAWFLNGAAPEELRSLADRYFNARSARRKFWDTLPTAMVMDEMNPPRPTHVRIRGVYDDLGEQVSPAVPSVFPQMPEDSPQNRLGFAHWLVDGNHPLTARVAMNRYWQKYFGFGLVKTPEDFGVQGERPSHPELLDWLASEFVRSHWDIKAMQKLIVTSATYRQSSKVTPQRFRRDRDNRLLARGPRQRLPAHTIRDQALFVSGLMVEQLGGPSVSPYQPKNLWKEMSNMTYRQSKGDDLYRRSLYTIWKRTVAPPSMAILDAADRESCWVRTKRTNTPVQALTLLNETAFVESARRLGQRMIGERHPVEFAFRVVTARLPKKDELNLLRQARAEYLAEYKNQPESAKKLVAVGASKPPAGVDPVELAANTVLANVLLNLDEVITKE